MRIRFIFSLLILCHLTSTLAQKKETLYPNTVDREGEKPTITMKEVKDLPQATRPYPKGFEAEDALIRKRFAPNASYAKFRMDQEILEKRTADAKFFDNGNGTETAVISSGKTHYLEDGLWKTISNDFSKNIGAYPFANIHNEVKTYYAHTGIKANNSKGLLLDKMSPQSIVIVDDEGQIIKELNVAQQVAPILSNSDALVYKNVYPQIDFEVKQFTGAFKTHYTLYQNNFTGLPQNAEFAVFTESLSLPSGASVRQLKGDNEQKNAGLEIVDSHNEVLFLYGIPTYFEKAYEHKYSKHSQADMRYDLQGNVLTIKINIPIAWLTNAQTVYPIVIDPTVTLTPTNASWWTGNVDEDGQQNGNSAEIFVGFDDGTGGNDQYHGWAKFNLASISDCSDITSANVNLYQNGWINGSGNDACSWTMGWANTDPVPDALSTIFNAIQGQETYCKWNVWGNCGGACYDFNEACCGWETMNMDVANFRNRLELRTLNDFITVGLDQLDGDYDCFFCYSDEDNWLEFDGYNFTNPPQLVLTYNSLPATTTYTSNTWNIYAYNGSAFTTYYGYATNTTSTEFNLGAFGMGVTSNPSALAGYQGCVLGNDNWSISAKRQGWTCGVYNVIGRGHDDGVQVFVDYDGNGTFDYTSTNFGCCNNAGFNNVTLWTGVLNSNSKVQINLTEGGGDAYVDVDFTAVTPAALSAGTISGITDGITICTGGDPGSFSTSAAASGGVGTGYTGGSYTYQWESSTTSATTGFANISGATAQTYDPAAITATTWFRRKVTDACGNTATSGTIQAVVVADPTASTPAFTAATICVGGSTNVSVTAANGTGSYTYQWQYFNGSTWNNVVNGTPAGSTYTNATSATMTIAGISAAAAYQYRCNVGATGVGCDVISSVASTLTVVADPTISAQPLTTQTVCVGGSPTNLTLTPAGGTGTFSYQWYSNTTNSNSGGTSLGSTSGAQTATYTPSSATVGTFYYYCVVSQTGLGCGPVSSSPATVVIADYPTTTGTTICQGGSGTISSSTTCPNSFINSGTTISGTWVAATDPIAKRPVSLSGMVNTSTCSFDPSITRNYVATTFQVSVTGNYIFEMNDNTNYDGMGYIVTGAFVPGTCPGAGTWVRGDDDDGVLGNEPRLGASGSGSGLMTLTAGTSYTLISTTYGTSSGTYSGSFAWTVTPPAGGQILLQGTGQIQWYTAASGGTLIGTGSPFNPVGVAGSSLANTNTAGTTTFYAACSGSTACRTATNFVILPTPTSSISGTTTVCQNATAPTITFTNPQTLPVTITYNINGASNTTINVGASTTATVSAATSTAGAFAYNLVSVAYQSAPTCSNTISGSATVTVRPTPTASISGTTTVCQNATAPTITFTNPQTLALTITYNINGGSNTTINVGASTTATVTAATGTAGTFAYNLVSIVYQTAPTCSNTISGSATVTVLPTPTASVSGTTTVCQNATAPTITFTNPQTLPVTITYNINGASNTTINVGASTTATVSAATSTAGAFAYNLVSVAYQTAPICSNTISGSATVTVRPTPTASISGTTTVCQNATAPTITFTNPQTLPVTITYNINGASNTTINVGASTTATVTAATSTAGTFAYNLVSVAYQTAPTCSNTISGSATLTVNPRPTATTCKVADPCQTSSGQITVNISGGTTPYTITYSPAGTPASPITTSAASAIITGLTGGQTYNFVVSDANNCTAP